MLIRNMAAGLVASVVLVGGLAACNKGKQEASIGLDEARLAVASARNGGAESYASSTLRQAEGRLDQAERKFKKGLWTDAKKDAAVASQIAHQALTQARAAMTRKPTRSRPARRR